MEINLSQLLEEYLVADSYLASIKEEAGTHRYIKTQQIIAKLDKQIDILLDQIVSKIKLPDEPEY